MFFRRESCCLERKRHSLVKETVKGKDKVPESLASQSTP